MTVLSIARDWGPNVCIVRMQVNDTLSVVSLPGYIANAAIQASIVSVNEGPFEWRQGDVVLVEFINPSTLVTSGSQFFYIFPDFASLVALPPLYPNLQNIVATPAGTQLTSTAVNTGINVIVTAVAGSGVVLPANVIGTTVIVVNNGLNPVNVFPAPGDSINGLSANTPYVLPVGQLTTFWGTSSTSWYTNTSATSSLSPVYPQVTGITAHAGGGQSGGVLLTPGISVVTVVATAGDSVTLPLNILGQTFIIRNLSTTNNLGIFPPLGANFYGLGANAVLLGVPSSTSFIVGIEPQRLSYQTFTD